MLQGIYFRPKEVNMAFNALEMGDQRLTSSGLNVNILLWPKCGQVRAGPYKMVPLSRRKKTPITQWIRWLGNSVLVLPD